MKRTLRILLIAICLCGFSAAGSYLFAAERIDNVASEAKVIPVSGGIEVSATETTRFEVYSITGQQIKVVTVGNESQTIELPNGCYIVRTPQWSKKVIVK